MISTVNRELLYSFAAVPRFKTLQQRIHVFNPTRVTFNYRLQASRLLHVAGSLFISHCIIQARESLFSLYNPVTLSIPP
jgi:membrane-anchored protein YejM (alkaline phosphatase superfamily)